MKARKSLPDCQFEERFWQEGYLVVGIDEVGRGSLAGPIGVGLVCFLPKKARQLANRSVVKDSKALSAEKRRKLALIIKRQALVHIVSYSNVNVINQKGIVKAFEKAVRRGMQELQQQLPGKKLFLLVDAFVVKHVPQIGLKGQLAIVKGDTLCFSIAAASIIAKVARDEYMSGLSQVYPHYQWHRNKGYGTRQHIRAIQKHGISKLHRRLFVRNVLSLQNNS